MAFSFLKNDPQSFDCGDIRIRLEVVDRHIAAIWVVNAQDQRVPNPKGYAIINMSTGAAARPRSNGEIMISCFSEYEVRVDSVAKLTIHPKQQMSMHRVGDSEQSDDTVWRSPLTLTETSNKFEFQR